MPSPASLGALSLAVGAVRCPVCSWPCSLPCAARSADGRLRRVRAAQACSRQSSCVFVFTLSPGKGLPFPLPSEDGGCAATRTQGTGGAVCCLELPSPPRHSWRRFGPDSIFFPPCRSPPPSRLSHDVQETHATHLKEFMTLHSGCQVLTSCEHTPISCLGKDSPTLNLFISQFPRCSATSWHSPHQSGPGPLAQPHGYLSFLIPLCQPRDPPLPFIRYCC